MTVNNPELAVVPSIEGQREGDERKNSGILSLPSVRRR
jgi:hypothetical protein